MSTEANKANAAQPPPGHDKMLEGLRKIISVPKSEIDRREAQWRETRKPRNKSKKEKNP